ncbi:MAG: OB-fold nucleic acid binding domain-containing protein [Propionibacteriaceae bacterium]|nr:OB-fold nucleic acid binding domain-containing protein [Propionibacteriaceae bacterium]
MSWVERLKGLLRPIDEIDSADRERLAAAVPCDPIASCEDRGRVVVRGTIGALTLRQRQDTPWLEAELSDATGSVTLIWMGRHEIPGIEEGRELLVRGRLSVADGVRRLYNPHYELV